MLVAKRAPSQGDTALALLIERSRQAPPRLRTIDPSIPEGVDKIVARCLEPDPDARYQTTRELEADLDRLDAEGHERVPVQAPVPAAAPATSKIALIGVAAAVVALLAVGGWFVMQAGSASAAGGRGNRDPVSVLIADFDNQAKEPVFEGSLEQALNIAIEGASFITSYSRASAQTLANQLKPGSKLDESAARLVAAREGIKIVMTGCVAARGSGYTLSVKAVDPVHRQRAGDGRQRRCADKAGVLERRRARGVDAARRARRHDAGERAPRGRRDGHRRVARSAAGVLERAGSRSDRPLGRSIAQYRRAIELDPNFGRAYSGWATELYNSRPPRRGGRAVQEGAGPRRSHDRAREIPHAGRVLPRAGRELRAGDRPLPGAASSATRPIARPTTTSALAYFNLLDFAKAKEQALHAVEIYPQNTRFRNNYALYAMYSGDFKTAGDEADKVLAQSPSLYKAYLVQGGRGIRRRQPAGHARRVRADGGERRRRRRSRSRATASPIWRSTKAGRRMPSPSCATASPPTRRRTIAAARAAKLAMLAEAQAADNQLPAALATAREAIALVA